MGLSANGIAASKNKSVTFILLDATTPDQTPMLWKTDPIF